jgi:hypothetical protein
LELCVIRVIAGGQSCLPPQDRARTGAERAVRRVGDLTPVCFPLMPKDVRKENKSGKTVTQVDYEHIAAWLAARERANVSTLDQKY